MKLKQIIGIPLLLLFVGVLANRLVDNLSPAGGGTPILILAGLILLMLIMLMVKQLRD